MKLDGIDCLGIDRVLRRGSGEIIADTDHALLIRDDVSGAYMLACDDPSTGMALLDRHISRDCSLLMVSDYALGIAAFERYGFSEKLECFQVAYFGEKPAADSRLTVRAAEEQDLPMLTATYHLVSPEELEKLIRRRSILLGYERERLIGFIGEHLEGSMGILYVFPAYRRRGFGSALQKHLIIQTMEKGYIPFGQVEKDNRNSLRLQKKIGMTKSDDLIVWMWR
ncbi:MAG: GNAT family N-acetyltransferase [Firmicutes bacterium]|nr:GNAT family N-acetyltransferase [Lachnospiraceae bacterium]MBQ7057688.1 GNAT family N-acetyltransferase [Bacillota bacterium]